MKIPNMKQADAKEVFEALFDMIGFALSGDRYESRNPYTIPQVNKALKIVAKIQGKLSYDVFNEKEWREYYKKWEHSTLTKRDMSLWGTKGKGKGTSGGTGGFSSPLRGK